MSLPALARFLGSTFWWILILHALRWQTHACADMASRGDWKGCLRKFATVLSLVYAAGCVGGFVFWLIGPVFEGLRILEYCGVELHPELTRFAVTHPALRLHGRTSQGQRHPNAQLGFLLLGLSTRGAQGAMPCAGLWVLERAPAPAPAPAPAQVMRPWLLHAMHQCQAPSHVPLAVQHVAVPPRHLGAGLLLLPMNLFLSPWAAPVLFSPPPPVVQVIAVPPRHLGRRVGPAVPADAAQERAPALGLGQLLGARLPVRPGASAGAGGCVCVYAQLLCLCAGEPGMAVELRERSGSLWAFLYGLVPTLV